VARKVVSVIERRLQGENVFRVSSAPIPLKEPKAWTLRWENTEIATDHLWNLLHNLGWAYCEPDDLACDIQEIGAFIQDGKIVRGERGKEILMKMPLKDYQRLQKAKDEQNRKATFGKKQVQQAIIAKASDELGDQAAHFLNEHLGKSMVTNDARERVALDE
jgi:hypothetical protein